MVATTGDLAQAGDDLRDFVQRVQTNREARKQLARQSVAGFGLTYLRGDNERPMALPPAHLRWYRLFGSGEDFKQRDPRTGNYRQRKLLLLAPRDHGKTFGAGYVLPLQRIATHPNIRILLLGAEKGGSQERLLRIRTQLEENAQLAADFAPDGDGFRDRKKPWTNTQLYVRRDDRNLAGPTLRAVGAGGKITGGRADLILADDIEDEASTLTAGVRKKRRAWWFGNVQELLEPWGQLIVIGTRKHNDDVYAHMMRDPTYVVHHDRAISAWPPDDDREWVRDEESGELIDCRVKSTQVQVLWPEKWPIGRLLVKRESMRSTLFNRENQNEVVDDEAARVKLQWLENARDRGTPRRNDKGELAYAGLPAWKSSREVPRGWVVFQAWDPAFVEDAKQAQETDSDYFTGETWAVNLMTWERRLIGGYHKRGLTSEQYKAAMREMAAPYARPSKLHPAGCLKGVVIETNSFGKHYEIGLRKSTDLPLKKHSTDKRKASPYDGLDAVGGMYETGIVSIAMAGREDDDEYRELVQTLIAEWHGLGLERHDDTALCQWIAECAIRRYKVAVEAANRNRKRPNPARPRVASTRVHIEDAVDEAGESTESAPDEEGPAPPKARTSPDPAAAAAKAVRTGKAVRCTRTEYVDAVRTTLVEVQREMVMASDVVGAAHAEAELHRLDRLFKLGAFAPPPPPVEVASMDEDGGDAPPPPRRRDPVEPRRRRRAAVLTRLR